jgi:hypothetical protein
VPVVLPRGELAGWIPVDAEPGRSDPLVLGRLKLPRSPPPKEYVEKARGMSTREDARVLPGLGKG